MSVEIDPLELTFQQPFTVEISRILKIKNPNKTPLAFKVKTTAPKQYCVRPNSGRVEPGQDVEVTVLLQAMKQEPAPGTKCRDKFLVQSIPITADKEFAGVASILEGADKSTIQERKIRVNWITDKNPSTPAAAMTPKRQSMANETDTPDAARTFASPSGGDDAQTSGSPAPPPYEDDEASEHEKSTVSAAASAVTNNVPMTMEELKAKLAEAETTISTLQKNAASGLRQRKPQADKIPSAQEAAQAVRQNVSGVSVQIVALLCLLSFLLAYFFF